MKGRRGGLRALKQEGKRVMQVTKKDVEERERERESVSMGIPLEFLNSAFK